MTSKGELKMKRTQVLTGSEAIKANLELSNSLDIATLERMNENGVYVEANDGRIGCFVTEKENGV